MTPMETVGQITILIGIFFCALMLFQTTDKFTTPIMENVFSLPLYTPPTIMATQVEIQTTQTIIIIIGFTLIILGIIIKEAYKKKKQRGKHHADKKETNRRNKNA